jgi:hypothetical protein
VNPIWISTVFEFSSWWLSLWKLWGCWKGVKTRSPSCLTRFSTSPMKGESGNRDGVHSTIPGPSSYHSLWVCCSFSRLVSCEIIFYLSLCLTTVLGAYFELCKY